MSSAAVFRNSAVRSALRATAPSATKRAAIASTTFTRGKATLPDLPCKLRPLRFLHLALELTT